MSNKFTKSVRGKLFKYFKQRLNIKISTKGWYRSDCPHCGGNYCFAVSLIKNRGRCFKCGEDGMLIEHLMDMENLSTLNDARNFLKVQKEYEEYEDIIVKPRFERKQVILPESFRLIIRKEGLLGGNAQGYMKKRGFDIMDIAQRGVGYCLEGEYAGYIIFPFYKKGELVFFQGRKFMGWGPKMKNPTNEEFGKGKTELIYNQDALFMYNRINVVESITNCLTIGDNTVALLGKHISDYQLSMLMKSPCTHITILLDDDALKEAAELAMKLVPYKKVRVVLMPKKKDVNDLGKMKTKRLMHRTEYQNYNYFFKLKADECKSKSNLIRGF